MEPALIVQLTYEAELEEGLSSDSLRLLVNLGGLGYAFVTVSEVVVRYSVDVREEVAVQYSVHVWEVVVVRYHVQGEMVVRYLVHRWVVPFFAHGGEVAVSVHVQEAVEAGHDLLPLREEEEEAL